MTPYDDTFPSCDRTCAQLVIYPEELDARQVTARLQLEPTSSRSVGEVRSIGMGRTALVRNTVWCLSSENHVNSRDLRRHLDWLLDTIEPRAAALRQLQAEGSARMLLFLVWWSAEGLGGPIFWPEHLGRLASLGIECQFSLAFYSDDED